MGKRGNKPNIPQEMLELIVSLAAKEGAKTAAEEIRKDRNRERESRYDRRIYNTKLLLQNYRLFKEHCARAVFDASQLDENAIDILDMMCSRPEKTFVASIKRSVQRTAIIVNHIDVMLDVFFVLCERSGKEEDLRRKRVINALYIADKTMTIDEISEQEGVNNRTIYRDIEISVDKLTGLIFGLDGLKNNAV